MSLNVLVDVGDQLVRNSLHVLFPELAILALAASVITLDAVQQQDGHVDDVEVRQQVLGAAGHAHGQGDQEITNIVEVTRETPVSGAEEERLVGLAVRGDERGADHLGGLAPDHALAVGRADNVLLVVDRAEDEVTSEADGENETELDGGQVDGVADQVVRLESVLLALKLVKEIPLRLVCWHLNSLRYKHRRKQSVMLSLNVMKNRHN